MVLFYQFLDYTDLGLDPYENIINKMKKIGSYSM